MMQPKISAFFKPSDPKSLEKCERPESDIQRENEKWNLKSAKSGSKVASANKILNKKRSYAQYHLELGQSDFLLHTCNVCGLMYAKGEEDDEKVHKEFHKEYYEGVRFKGWHNERVVSVHSDAGDRVLMVVNEDSPVQKRKLQSVVKFIEKELGFADGEILHKLCKAYLYISNHRIVGCLVAEPIKTAHRVIVSHPTAKNSSDTTEKSDSRGPNRTLLHFGDIGFNLEVIKRCKLTKSRETDQWVNGAILSEEKAVPALCGVRAIWVVPSHRRKGIGSKLLDAMRKSFCADKQLEHAECAFSSPTSAGHALATSYTRSMSFLVYRSGDV
ncbi:putative transcription regulator GNAT family [Dioscorea sansibarensis]